MAATVWHRPFLVVFTVFKSMTSLIFLNGVLQKRSSAADLRSVNRSFLL